MKDLSLHILDIVQNSLSAGAQNIIITIDEDAVADRLNILIQDDGAGMAPDVLERVTDPYYTSRTTRKVGLGLPLFRQNAEMSGGSFTIDSQPSKGTVVKANFGYHHIDRQPLGDVPGVIMILVGSNPEKEFYYKHRINGKEYVFDTREAREALDGIPINEPSVIRYLKEMIRENLQELQENKK